MKNWMKVWISVLFVTVFSVLTVSAKDSGSAVLQQVEGTKDLTVSLELAEGMTENITSLHFKMYVSLESGTMSAQPSFDFSGLITEHMTVYSSSVSWDEEDGDYIVDVIVSGGRQETIFLLDGIHDGKVLVGTLNLPEEDFYAEVGFVDTDSTEQDVPVLQYMDRGGVEAMSVRLTNAEPVFVGQKPQPETETEPVQPQPQPGTQTGPEEEPLPTTPLPSGPVTSDAYQPNPTPEPESEPTPAPAPETEAKSVLKPAEPAKNDLKAPKLTVSVKTGTKTVSLSWKRVKGAVGYQILKYDAKSGKYKKYRNVKTTSYTGEFSFGETCRFRVRAYKKDGGSKVYGAYSAEREVTVSAFNKAKKAKLRVSASKKDRQFRFRWNEVPGADGYQLLTYDTKTKRYKTMKTIKGGETLEFRSANYKYATTYRFRMRAFAYDEDGDKVFGARSAEVSFTTRPAKVKNVKVKSKTESRVNLTWKKVSRADGYYIYRSLANRSDVMKRVAIVKGGKILRYVDRNLESGSTYYYQIAAYKTLPNGKRKAGNRSAVKSVEVK